MCPDQAVNTATGTETNGCVSGLAATLAPPAKMLATNSHCVLVCFCNPPPSKKNYLGFVTHRLAKLANREGFFLFVLVSSADQVAPRLLHGDN